MKGKIPNAATKRIERVLIKLRHFFPLIPSFIKVIFPTLILLEDIALAF